MLCKNISWNQYLSKNVDLTEKMLFSCKSGDCVFDDFSTLWSVEMAQYGKLINLVSPYIFLNQLFSKVFSKAITFMIFSQKCAEKYEITEIHSHTYLAKISWK